MSASVVYQYDVGIVITVTIGESTVGLTKQELHVKCPDGSVKIWATSTNNSTSIKYTSVAGDFDVLGVYFIQSYVESGATSKHHGKTFTINCIQEFL